MNTGDMVFTVIGAFIALIGLASLVTGKVYGMASAVKYTDESLNRYARPTGFARLLMGAGLMAFHLVPGHLFDINGAHVSTGLVALVGSLVVSTVIFLASSRMLVKRVAA